MKIPDAYYKQMNGDDAVTGSSLGASRRGFLKTAGTAVAASAFFTVNKAHAENFGNPVLVETDPSVEIKYSVCLGCHNACGIRCKVVDGILVKIDGNPYHPNNLEPHLPYATDTEEARLIPGRLCAKGQAGIQVLYNPMRIKEPLRRVGPRGAGQWAPISWDTAFSEIGNALNALRDLDTSIDAGAPELGPLANKVVFSGGRNQHGQKDFTDRFWGSSFGTVNKRHDHTSICETSHHVAYSLATGNKAYSDASSSKAVTKGSTDLPNCEFMLWFGSDPMSANFPFVAQARKLSTMLENGGKLAVVDPRCNVAASKADWWLPIKPGTDAALALAMGRYIIDNNKHNTDFLQRPHNNATNTTGELNVTDATYLVKIELGHATGYLRSDEAGLGGTSSDFVVWSNGAAEQYDTVDIGDLEPGSVVVNGITCKTAFELYAEQTRRYTIDVWAAICEIDEARIVEVAAELTAHGRKVSIELYRGAVQHTNGTYNALAIINLNSLLGNYNWVGGHTFGGSHWHETGGKTGNRFTPTTVDGGVSNSGMRITRAKHAYEDTAEFAANGYPAQRPWFPFALNLNYQEILPSIEDQYPYAIGAFIQYWNCIPYSTPAARKTAERVMKDVTKVPLSVAIDIEMGELTALCDYILPDTTYFERWSMPHLGSAMNTKASPVRQPVVGTFDGQMNYTPFLPNTKMMEDILIGLGTQMGLPMDIKDEFGVGQPLVRAWDFHSQMISNIADEGSGVPGATPQERLQYVLDRGGRFEDYGGLYDGTKMAHRWKGRFHFYSEHVGMSRDSITGKQFDGVAKYEPPADLHDDPVDQFDAHLPLYLCTYKQAWHSMARTICLPWLVSIQPENFVELNSIDAASRGIRTGDRVRVVSSSLPEGAIGLARVTETVRPGVVGVAHSFGHWEMSSKSYKVDGVSSDSDPSRAVGIAANPIMRADPQLPNVALQDKLGGSVSFYNTRVDVEKV